MTLMSKLHARRNNSFLKLGQALKPVILDFETCVKWLYFESETFKKTPANCCHLWFSVQEI